MRKAFIFDVNNDDDESKIAFKIMKNEEKEEVTLLSKV